MLIGTQSVSPLISGTNLYSSLSTICFIIIQSMIEEHVHMMRSLIFLSSIYSIQTHINSTPQIVATHRREFLHIKQPCRMHLQCWFIASLTVNKFSFRSMNIIRIASLKFHLLPCNLLSENSHCFALTLSRTKNPPLDAFWYSSPFVRTFSAWTSIWVTPPTQNHTGKRKPYKEIWLHRGWNTY